MFKQTWGPAGVGRIAVIHIDRGWYDLVKFCLEVCADKVSEGGVIVIDDYNDYGGCRVAVDEFLASRRDFTFEPGDNPILRKKSMPGIS